MASRQKIQTLGLPRRGRAATGARLEVRVPRSVLRAIRLLYCWFPANERRRVSGATVPGGLELGHPLPVDLPEGGVDVVVGRAGGDPGLADGDEQVEGAGVVDRAGQEGGGRG